VQRRPNAKLREKLRVARAERKRPRMRRERDLVRSYVEIRIAGRVGAIRTGERTRKRGVTMLVEPRNLSMLVCALSKSW